MCFKLHVMQVGEVSCIFFTLISFTQMELEHVASVVTLVRSIQRV